MVKGKEKPPYAFNYIHVPIPENVFDQFPLGPLTKRLEGQKGLVDPTQTTILLVTEGPGEDSEKRSLVIMDGKDFAQRFMKAWEIAADVSVAVQDAMINKLARLSGGLKH